MSPPWDVVGGISLLAGSAFFNWLFDRANRSGREIEDAPEIALDKVKEHLLEKKGPIPYACISGTVTATNNVLQSKHYASSTGVMRYSRLEEHRSKWSQGMWLDEKKVLLDHLDAVPFHLTGYTEGSVHIREPLVADFIRDDLMVVYDHFEPSKDRLLTRTVDRLFGEISKGIQETERMLSVGIPLVGVGRLTYDGKNAYLSPPTDGRSYVLTARSKGEIVREMKSNARIYQVVSYLMLCGMLGCLGYYMYRKYKLYSKQRDLAKTQRAILQRRAATRTPRNDTDECGNVCVVCLERPKEVILLDCGHVCMCFNCVSALPDSKCPICRQRIVKVLPAYIS